VIVSYKVTDPSGNTVPTGSVTVRGSSPWLRFAKTLADVKSNRIAAAVSPTFLL
jgi:hypothetical protein